MSEQKLSTYSQKTIAYLESEIGIQNWNRNRNQYGFGDFKNLATAVMTACRLISWDKISTVMRAVNHSALKFSA